MSEEKPVPIQRAKPLEWNLNTLVHIGGLAVMLTTFLAVGINLRRDVNENKAWEARHEIEVREIRNAVYAEIARVAATVTALDERTDILESLTVRMGDRLSSAEAREAEFSNALRELQDVINDQNSDLRVIRSWIDDQRRNERNSNQ